jgi:hypothetical protein
MAYRCRRLGVIVLPFLLLAAASIPALAWNATGHEVVAEIAWRELKPAVREKITALLKEHPQYTTYLAPADVQPDAPEYNLRVFMRAAIWSDLVRSGRGRDREFHHPEWHYVDFPIVLGNVDLAAAGLPPTSDKLEEGKPPQNLLQAFEFNLQRLRTADTPAPDKAVALTWVEHLVGDVHQPLHSCTLVTPDYPRGDRGGNSFAIKYRGVPTNLHSFWDERLGGYMAWRLVDAVTDKAAEANPRSNFEKELADDKVTDWAKESFALARDVVYDGGKLKGGQRDAKDAAPELPEGYDATANELARRRAALAGYRLADLLNHLFE